MTRWPILLLLLLLALLVTGLAACTPATPPATATASAPPAGTSAAPSGAVSPSAAAEGAPAAATVRALIDRTSDFAGRSVSLTGQIVMECSQGCWFFLDDGTARIYVDLSTAGLSIPQWVGKKVTVFGKIKGEGGNLQLLGDEVRSLE